MSYVIGTTRFVFNISDHLVYHCLQVRRGGEMTGGVVESTLYQTVHDQGVILVGGDLVVVTRGGVVTQQIIATVTCV